VQPSSVNNENTQSKESQEKIDAKEGNNPQLVVDLPVDQEGKIPQVIELIQKAVPGVKIEILTKAELLQKRTLFFANMNVPKKGIPFSALSKYQNDKEEIKFSKMISLIHRNGLNEDQAEDLNNFKEVIVSTLNSYITSSYSTYGMPTLFHSRPHLFSVQNKKKKIENNDDSIQNTDTLFSLWTEMNGLNSKDVKGKISDLLNSIYTLLLKGAQPDHQYEANFANAM
jgi:hypothetical protein